ncbi:MAG: dihydrofolate reductase [Erysipelothrix sp.]|jgi:dihydrofolate reductase|nr:dihydrofolate reductase [Erysipelothrix sp.]
MITLIAAVNHNMLLGKDNDLPWHVKEDLQHFKAQTLHKSVLMGRKTFESLPTSLKDRTIYVLTNQLNYEVKLADVHVIHDVSALIAQYQDGKEELMVAGGGVVFELMMPYTSKILLSIIDDNQHGDVYFPQIPADFHLNAIQNMGTFVLREYRRHV